MKNLNLTISSILVAFALLSITFSEACKKSDTTNSEDANLKFVGVYQGTTSVNPNPCSCGCNYENECIITAKSDPSSILIVLSENSPPGYTLNATVSGNSITIPSQTSYGDVIHGSGSLNNNTLTITTIRGTPTCVFTGTK